MARCKACGWRRAQEQHHFLVHARWRRGESWRQDTPTVGLCRRCHDHVTRWDTRPATWLPLITLCYMLWRWFWNLVILGIVVLVLWAYYH